MALKIDFFLSFFVVDRSLAYCRTVNVMEKDALNHKTIVCVCNVVVGSLGLYDV